jgi:hypothetical protein
MDAKSTQTNSGFVPIVSLMLFTAEKEEHVEGRRERE